MAFILSAPLLLSGCAGLTASFDTDATNKARAAKAAAGADLVAAGQIVRLAEALANAPDGLDYGTLALTLNEAANGLFQDGQALKTGTAMPKGTVEQVRLALPTLRALISANEKAGPGRAGRATGYLEGFIAEVKLYDLDAPAAGLPKAGIPGG